MVEYSIHLFVGQLPWEATDNDLKTHFENNELYSIEQAYVVRDRFNNRSRGFGFVVISSTDETIYDFVHNLINLINTSSSTEVATGANNTLAYLNNRKIRLEIALRHRNNITAPSYNRYSTASRQY